MVGAEIGSGRQIPRLPYPGIRRTACGYSVARRGRADHCRAHCFDRHIPRTRHGPNAEGEQARLVADLLDYLFTHNREPLWLVLEEADAFAPQQPMGELTRVLGEVDRIARRGRNFGFRLIAITQRPANLNKDVQTQLSTLIALGVTSPQDRDAIKAWVDGNADREQAKRVYDSLARLPVGEGWIWAPDHDLLKHVKFPPIHTLDTSKTPKAGDARITPPGRASADLAKIAKQIQAIQATQQ